MKRDLSFAFIYPRMRYPSGDFPLGIACLSAFLKRELPDLRVSVIDTTFHRSFRWLEGEIKRRQPGIVGIHVDTSMFMDAVRAAEIAKRHGCHVIAGGPHATILPETLLDQATFDAVLPGEAETSLAEYIRALRAGSDPAAIPGVAVRRGGELRLTPPSGLPIDLDSLPAPDLALFDLKRYLRRFLQLDSYDPRLPGLSMIVSRGCPWACSFCQPTLDRIFGRPPRIMSAARVVSLIGSYVQQHRIRAFYFQDDTLTFFHDWMSEFCWRMARERLPLAWGCNSRADTVDLELLRTMKEAGCVKLKVGIESASDRVRNGIYDKRVSLADVERLLGWCRDLGIQTAGFFMLGAPGESEEEVRRTIDWAIASDLVEANFSITTPFPGTGLHRLARERGRTLPERYADYDYYQVRHRPSTPGDIPSATLARLKKEANLRFYLHPRRLGSVLRSFVSPRGLAKVGNKLRRV